MKKTYRHSIIGKYIQVVIIHLQRTIYDIFMNNLLNGVLAILNLSQAINIKIYYHAVQHEHVEI